MITRSATLSFAIAATMAVLAFGKPASAAPIGAVVKACDRTAGCNYNVNNKNGDLSGCSKHACFYCPNDGKRQCFPTGA